MKREIWLFLFFTCLHAVSWAQTKQITGAVSRQGTNENLAGVTVTVKGTSIITSTNSEGKFTINVPEGNRVLVISSVGYRTQEVNIGDRTTLTVPLEEQATQLTDVV